MSELPNDYLVLGVDTTGLAEDDLIWSISHLWVVDGQIVESETNYPDWSRYPEILPPAWLEARLAAAAHVAAQRGKALPTLEKLQRYGEDPKDLLRSYCDWFERLARSGTLVVGHNLLGFDWLVLRRHVRLWLGADLPVPAHIWDTGLVEKAISGNLPLSGQEMGQQLFERLADTRASVQWSLDYCLQDLGLSVGVDRQDCLYRVRAIHTIYQSQRNTLLAAGSHGQPSENLLDHGK